MLRERAAEEAAIDRRPLVDRKLAVDSALAPAFLLLELSDANRLELLAPFRFNYEPGTFTLQGPAEDTAKAVKALHSAWARASHAGVGFDYRSERFGAVNDDFPALIQWRGTLKDGSLELRAHWFEPFLGQRRLDFPLNPEALVIRFTTDHASVRSPLPAVQSLAESFPRHQPVLRKSSDIYDLFDSMRVASFILRYPPPTTPGEQPQALLVSQHTNEDLGMLATVRTIEWGLQLGAVATATIWQPVILLQYEAPHRLVGEARVEGSLVDGSSVRPRTELPYFPVGLQAEISFRAADSGEAGADGAGSALPDLRLPSTVEFLVRGAPLARSRFGRFRFGAEAEQSLGRSTEWDELESASRGAHERFDRLSSGADPRSIPIYQDHEILGEIDPLLARWRLRVNLLSAARLLDSEAHDHAMTLLVRRLSQDGVDQRWAAMNAQAWVEELAGPLHAGGAAILLAVPAWLSLAGALDQGEQLAELCRLMISGRWMFALLLARSLEADSLPLGAKDWLARIRPRLELWARDRSAQPERIGPHAHWNLMVDQALLPLIDLGVSP